MWIRTGNLRGWIIAVAAAVFGAVSLILAVTGPKSRFEESDNPQMRAWVEKFGAGKVRLFYGILGAGLLIFGLWLLHGLLFVKQ